MHKRYKIYPAHDGRLYVEVPSFNHLVTLLLQQRWRGTANLRTIDGYVPYRNGGIAFNALRLLLRGVKPLWYNAGNHDYDDYDEAVQELVADGWYDSEREAEKHHQQDSYVKECEWRGPHGMRFDLDDVDYVWVGCKDSAKAETLRDFLPWRIPIYVGAPTKD